MTPELDSKMLHAQVTLITPCEDLDTYEVLRAVVEHAAVSRRRMWLLCAPLHARCVDLSTAVKLCTECFGDSQPRTITPVILSLRF